MDEDNPPSGSQMLPWKAKEAGRAELPSSPEPSSGHIPFLPSEIIIAILEKACKLPLSRKDRQLLVACTLVCKYWLPLARSLLYDYVIVQAGSYYANTQDPGACGSTALLKQPHVLDFTKSLSISVIGKAKVISLRHISKDFTPNGNPKRTRVPDFFALLGHTRQLRCLTLSIGSADKNISPSEPHLLYWLPSLKLPIEVLDIEGGFNSGDFLRSTFACHLVGIWWDTIRALRVFTGRARDDGPLPAERPYIRLRELRFYSTLSAEMLRVNWLLPLPPPDEQSSLRFLTLSKIPEEMHAVLSVHGPSVSSLTLTSQPTFEIAQLFTNLEELVINDPCWKNISGLPRTLKHIRLDVMAWLSDPLLSWSNTLVAAIVKELPTFPNLGLISIEEALTTNKYYPDLQKACEIHKVKILLIPKPNNSSRTLRFQLVCDALHSPTTGRSILISSRWIVFLDNIPSPSSSASGLDGFERFLTLGHVRQVRRRNMDLRKWEKLESVGGLSAEMF